LGLKEDVSNKANTPLGTSTTLYPTQNAVKTYVDAQVAGATIADANGSTKGKIQLAGDLGGTAAAPTVPGLALKLDANQKGVANGVATLNASGIIPSSQLPPVTVSSTTVVGSDAAMTALSNATFGSIAVRTDVNKNYVLSALPASTLGNWIELLTPGAPVQTVNGYIGAVNLSKTDLGLSEVNNTSDLNKPISTATQNALDLKADGTAVDAALATKLSTADATAALALKATSADVTSALATKLSTADATAALALKANSAEVTTALATKISTADATAALALKLDANKVAVANGVASLDALGKIPTDQIPAVSFSSVKVLGSEAEMLALGSAVVGSVVIRTDINKNYVLAVANPAVRANWIELLTPAPPVQTVNGYSGNVSITKADLGLGNVQNTSDADKVISTRTQTALDTKVDIVNGKGLSTNDYSTAEKTKLAAITGTNTGDQDLSAYATTSALNSKVDKVTGKGLSTNDYSTAEKTKLASINLSSYATISALALKAPLASPIFTGTVTAPTYASTPIPLTYTGSTIFWNPTQGLNAAITLTQNSALSFTTAPPVGSYGRVVLTQDATGGRTITLPTITNVTNKLLGSTSTSTMSLSTAGNSKDILNFYYDGTFVYWNIDQGYGTAFASGSTNLATGVNGTLAVANGGTGASTLSGLVKGNGTGAMTAAVAGTDYQAPLTLTTTGSGAATLSGNTLNIPSTTTYALPTASASDLGGVKVGSNLSISGGVLSADLSAANITGTLAVANGGTGVATSTGTGSVVLSTSPTLVTPNLGTPSTLVGTNISGTAANLTAGNVTTNANLTGDVTSVGNATTLAASGVVSGSYGSSTAIPTFTVDSKGRLTSASTTSITAGVNTLAYTTASSYATGGTVSGTTLTLAAADATNPGLISTETQTIVGAKTFSGGVTAPIYASAPQTLTDGSTISWNPNLGLNASVTLGGDRTLSFASTPAAGSYGTLVITQDATGGRNITLPSTANKILGSTSTTTIALSSAGGAKDILNFYYDGTNCFWSVGQGYGLASSSSATNLSTGVTGTLPVANGGTGVTSATGSGNLVLSTSPTLTTPALGTPSAVVLTNATGLPLASGVSGTLPVANGGTGVTTSTGTGNVVLSASPALTGTPTAPTATTGDNTTQIATTAFVTAAVAAGGGGGTTYTTGLNSSLGGYVFYVTPDGKHGLVAETYEFTDQLWSAFDKIKDPAYHSTNGKNFTDWRIPSMYELNLMYAMKTSLSMNGSRYWSSSFGGNTYAYQNKRWGDGAQYTEGSDVTYSIRAVRSF
jgi:hypothetical protein